MGPFQFRLKHLNKLKEAERNQAADSLQKAMLAAQQLELQISGLNNELDQQSSIQNQSIQGIIQPQKVLESQRYQLQVLVQLQSLKEKLDIILQECQRRRMLLFEREKECRVLEKLEEKQREQWQQEVHQAQQRVLDDWASYRHWASSSTSPDLQEGV